MKNLFNVLFISSILFYGCEKKEDFPTPTNISESKSGVYELDVDTIISTEFGKPDTGTFVISHNALAIFPIDLSSKKRVITNMGTNSIDEIQTLSTCEGGGRVELDSSHVLVWLINQKPPIQKDVAEILNLKIIMPYYSSQHKGQRIPENVCVGFRIKNKGWVWHFEGVKPSLDEVKKVGTAELKVNESNVDAIAILFETTTNVSKISFEVK